MSEDDYDSSSFVAATDKKLIETPPPPPHYYGDSVRKFFLIAAIVMFVTLPFLNERISYPLFFSIVGILVLTFFAGITSPRQGFIITADIGVSILGFAVFAYEAVTKFQKIFDLLFVTNIALACIFIFTLYFSLKTLRGFNQMGVREKAIATGNPPLPKRIWSKFRKAEPKSEHFTEEEMRKKRFLDKSTS